MESQRPPQVIPVKQINRPKTHNQNDEQSSHLQIRANFDPDHPRTIRSHVYQTPDKLINFRNERSSSQKSMKRSYKKNSRKNIKTSPEELNILLLRKRKEYLWKLNQNLKAALKNRGGSLPSKKYETKHAIRVGVYYLEQDMLLSALMKRLGFNLMKNCKTPRAWYGQELTPFREALMDAKNCVPFADYWPYAPNEACVGLFYSIFFDFLFKNSQHKNGLVIVPEFRVGKKPNQLRPDFALGNSPLAKENGDTGGRPRVIIELKKDLADRLQDATSQTQRYLEHFRKIPRPQNGSGSKHLACIALDLDRALIFWIPDVEKNDRVERFKLQWNFSNILHILKPYGSHKLKQSFTLSEFYVFSEFIRLLVNHDDI